MSNEQVHAAVECKFEVIGEPLNQVTKLDAKLAANSDTADFTSRMAHLDEKKAQTDNKPVHAQTLETEVFSR